MGVTEPWMVTTEGQKNWTAACEREILARFNWNDKWGWMPGVMAETIDKLKELKEKQIARLQEMGSTSKKGIMKNPRPLPNSVNHEYGWLSTRPEYQIERFGPFPLTMKVRVEPTMAEIEEEIEAQDLYRAKRALEQKKLAKLERKMAENAAMKSKHTVETDGSKSGLEIFDAELPGSQQQNVDVHQSDEGNPKTEDHDEAKAQPQGIPDPGHVSIKGKKKRVCCCTANCPCLKINRSPPT